LRNSSDIIHNSRDLRMPSPDLAVFAQNNFVPTSGPKHRPLRHSVSGHS
jgi:hypothetical protein